MIPSFATLLVVRNLRWAQEVIPLQQPQGLRELRQKEDVQGTVLTSKGLQAFQLQPRTLLSVVTSFIHSLS